jgi:hypothetical protein
LSAASFKGFLKKTYNVKGGVFAKVTEKLPPPAHLRLLIKLIQEMKFFALLRTKRFTQFLVSRKIGSMLKNSLRSNIEGVLKVL